MIPFGCGFGDTRECSTALLGALSGVILGGYSRIGVT